GSARRGARPVPRPGAGGAARASGAQGDRWAPLPLSGSSAAPAAGCPEQPRLSHPAGLSQRQGWKCETRLRPQVLEGGPLSAEAGRAAARFPDPCPAGDDAAFRSRRVQAREFPARVQGDRTESVRSFCLAVSVVVALAAATAAGAAWTVSRSGNGATASKTMPGAAPAAPTGSVSSHDVTVSWSASHFADGTNVPSYIVKRYDAITNALQTT